MGIPSGDLRRRGRTRHPADGKDGRKKSDQHQDIGPLRRDGETGHAHCLIFAHRDNTFLPAMPASTYWRRMKIY
jgi:hypothetical protein